jgi:hypothetical protein
MSDSKKFVPLWDILPLNSYLLALLPLEDVLRFVPATAQQDLAEIVRIAGAAWLLWHRQRGRDVSKGPWKLLLCLFVMDYAPTVYRISLEQWRKLNNIDWDLPATVTETQPTDHRSHLALERRQKMWKIIQSIWPLLRLGIWLRLATSKSDSPDDAPLLYPVYGHRRWMHEELMALWPTLIKPLLASSVETKRWIRQVIRHLWRENEN